MTGTSSLATEHSPWQIERDLAKEVLELLRQRGESLAVAESCTGGLLGAVLTAIPGASELFHGGAVAYQDDAKVELLGVNPRLLEEHGAVSEEVARDMAKGVKARLETSWAVGVTGIAGPSGGSPAKPVGTVWIAVDGERFSVSRFLFEGGREEVRRQAVRSALTLLRSTVESGGRGSGGGSNEKSNREG